ncbi:MAG: hypothetical protein UX91_C0001G0067 [Candidatus Amesbacteria bacterium GW2011_GWB1_47_19]|nr:MAG: hypothetical protein UW51_C0001G0067 [Candidatus Amesbacteria bacterium GW2011_GWA1_44_24]KKU32079.1 MAG: hypothetical protein UX46_C0001G0066 [Candidatus Amesbacteria bacterium GW2011_GWC1_46_24]KKU67763.1 MAG: hypothetical protein UX91_C0001G0067 [Candidatus Amesbacteria bacterium GW2011_GWB1_47_19]OGD06051.1 MAG: hypothetical protein A2379_03085 [Candidatus Amesbacteria bacterium RIFOXYB1_FULL_47_13]HBC72359.1 hypothetical protein [Candidatus Amesbacteria bacterium]
MSKVIIALIHYLVIILFASFPFWIAWYWVAVGAIAYHLIISRGLGYCPLTRWQYGTSGKGFIENHLKALFKLFNYSPDEARFRLFITYGIPVCLVFTAFLWQSLS